MCCRGVSPLGHVPFPRIRGHERYNAIRVEVSLDPDFLFVRLVDEPGAECLVDGLADLRARVLEHADEITQCGNECVDLLSGQDPRMLRLVSAKLGSGCGEVSFGLGHPLGDRPWIATADHHTRTTTTGRL